MNDPRRLIPCMALALAALLVLLSEAGATTYSVRVFDPDGKQITTDSITLNIMDSKSTTLLTQKSLTGLFVFTLTSPQKNNTTVVFNFTRQSTGTQFTISGICLQPVSPPSKTMDVVLP